jgi:hypothetical protein
MLSMQNTELSHRAHVKGICDHWLHGEVLRSSRSIPVRAGFRERLLCFVFRVHKTNSPSYCAGGRVVSLAQLRVLQVGVQRGCYQHPGTARCPARECPAGGGFRRSTNERAPTSLGHPAGARRPSNVANAWPAHGAEPSTRTRQWTWTRAASKNSSTSRWRGFCCT